jgi:hypothetical protein
MIKLKHILTEALSDIVWHFTSPQAAKKIIEQNKFELSIVSGADISKFGGNKQYYLSTARQKWGGYGKSYDCRLELDGRKLSQRYKGGAIDYWQMGPQGTEYEDRLFSNEPTIPNAKNYIKRVDLFLNAFVYRSNMTQLTAVMDACLKANIQCFLFRNEKKFQLGRDGELVTKEIADSLRQPIDPNESPYVSMPPNPERLDRLVYIAQVVGISKEELNTIFMSNQTAEKDFNSRMLQMEPDDRGKYGTYKDYIESGWKEYESKLWNMRLTFGGMDAKSVIDSEIHNAKRKMGSIARDILIRIYQEGRKNKITPDKMIPFIIQKAKENSEQENG